MAQSRLDTVLGAAARRGDRLGGGVADSTATVIGAMIVAPLMTPILGSALAVVVADRNRLI